MATTLEKASPCKVNLLLNILGRRPDGFHDLETVLHPVRLHDTLRLARGGSGVTLTCSDPELPVDGRNLVHRAATAFLAAAGVTEGVVLHLEKRIPMAAGLGGGSGNAATTLAGLNELFGRPLGPDRLQGLAASLGSDVPFFLQEGPALGTGRGEHIEAVGPLAAMQGRAFLLVHPGFGISTPWAYQQLARFPEALHGRPGRARALLGLLRGADLAAAAPAFYNALEAPALEKFPLLVLYQEFLRAAGALVTLMSGSGSTTFALARDVAEAGRLEEGVRSRFGPCWTAVVPV